MAQTRETKHRRSRSDLTAPRAPQERVQVFPHATPGVSPKADNLQILSQTFGNFFQGLQTAAVTMMEAEHQDNLREIREENKRQGAQGAADALAGKDPAMPNDLDYMEAFARTKGINVGGKAATDFITELSSRPLGEDPEKFREEWFKQQLGSGTGDPIHDAAMYATFKNQTDHAVLSFRINNAKYLRAKGIDALSQEIFVKAESATADDLRDWISRSTQLHLGDEVKARASVRAALAAAANTPKSLQRIVALLHSKGYVDDERGSSFSDLFPSAANDLSEMATKKYLSSLSAEAFDKYGSIEDKARDPSVISDPRKLFGLIGELEAVRDQYGGEAVYRRLYGKLEPHLKKLIADEAAWNAFLIRGRSGGYPIDKEAINKYMPRLVERKLALDVGPGATPLSSPKAAEITAEIVSTYQGMDTDLHASLSAALQDTRQPTAQANALRFFRKLESLGRDVSQYMTADAYKAYVALERLVRQEGNGTIEDAVKLYGSNPKAAQAVSEGGKGIDWPTLMGRPSDTREKVVTDVMDDLRDGIADALGVTGFLGMSAPGRIAMSEEVRQELLADYASTVQKYQAIGVADAQELARDAVVKSMSRNYLTLPGRDGSVQIVRARDYPAFRNAKIVGPGYYRNDATGEMENTLTNFRDDVEELKRVMPGQFGEIEQAYVGRDSNAVSEDGSFQLYNGDTLQPVRFVPGQEIALNEADGAILKRIKKIFGARVEGQRAITLSSNPEEAARELEALLPKYFKVKRQDTVWGPQFFVYYTFHVSDQPDLDVVGQSYKRPAMASDVAPYMAP